RVFTTKALALDIKDTNDPIAHGTGCSIEIIEIYTGIKDSKSTTLKTVEIAKGRITEDPLRIHRAIRRTTATGFTCNTETSNSIINKGGLLKKISKERIRDEFIRIVMSDSPMMGIELLRRHDILEYVLPEILSA